MRKIILALLIIGVNITGVSATGRVTSELLVTDPANAKVRISGDVGEATSEEIFLLIKRSDAEFSEGESLTGKDFYTKNISVEEDGSFQMDFVFDGKTGLYNVYISDLYNTGDGYVYDFNFISYEEVLEFVNKLGEKGIKKEDLVSELSKYSDSLGIGFEEIEDSEKKEYIATEITDNSQIIKDGGIDGIKRVMTFSDARFDILNGIENAKLSGDVYKKITENASLAEIPADIMAEFNNLKSSKQTAVCQKLLGKKFNYSEFLDAFEEEIKEAKKSTANSGGGSGSGGGSPISDKTGVSGGGYVMIPDTEDNVSETNRFGDIEDVKWASEAILYLAEKGIVNGVGEDKFNPNGELTREQFAKIIVGAFECYNENAECVFYDVPEGSWAEKYIASAFEKGLMNGVSETEFGFGENVTRQDAAVVLYRFAKLRGVEMISSEYEFGDSSQISEYAREAVSAMHGSGIISGMGNNTFSPKNATTRAQACKMIYEIMKRGVEE